MTRERTHAEEERFRRMFAAAGYPDLTEEERKFLWWLSGWDEWAIDAACALFQRLRGR